MEDHWACDGPLRACGETQFSSPGRAEAYGRRQTGRRFIVAVDICTALLNEHRVIPQSPGSRETFKIFLNPRIVDSMLLWRYDAFALGTFNLYPSPSDSSQLLQLLLGPVHADCRCHPPRLHRPHHGSLERLVLLPELENFLHQNSVQMVSSLVLRQSGVKLLSNWMCAWSPELHKRLCGCINREL